MVEDLPADWQGPDPSRGERIEIYLARCQQCHKVLTQTGDKFCDKACNHAWHNQRAKERE
jgi:rRNA maturation endonuclease Nob1